MPTKIVLVALLFVSGIGNSFYGSDTSPANDVGVQYLGHVAVGVSDLATAMHFYCDQLGLTEVFRINKPDGSVLLVYLRVNNNNFVELFPGAAKQTGDTSNLTGLRHLGFIVKNLQETLHTLQKRGVALPDDAFKQAAVVRADGTYLTFLKDPDGNMVEISEFLPDSKEAKSRR
jgi:catechol 2,3-dioxygenase-like lactoylglutathione lyase family enzyme